MSGVAARWARAELEWLAGRGLVRELEVLGSAQGPVVSVGGETLVNFSSNDYLGLAADARLVDAATRAAQQWGTGAGASRLVVGDLQPHRSLERALASLEGRDAAVVFPSGHAANTGVIPALVSTEDEIFSDELNHASLIDGARLSRAGITVYRHADAAHLEELLRASSAPRRLVATDAVFSMDGDVAPLAALAEVCRRHEAALLVDEAHATGVLGADGAGAAAEAGVVPDVSVMTLSKALGAQGGAVVGSAEVVRLIVNRARTLVFSTGLSPMVCAAAEAAVEIVRTGAALREALWRNVRQLAGGLEALGVPGPHGRTPIFAVRLGSPAAAMDTARALRRRGLLVKAIRPPTVPAGTSRLRIVVTAAHAPEHVERLVEALKHEVRT